VIEGLNFKGRCKIILRDKQGKIIYQDTDHNLIVTGTVTSVPVAKTDHEGKQGIIEWLGGDPDVGQLKNVGVGDGGTPVGEPNSPITPEVTWFELRRLIPVDSEVENPKEASILIGDHTLTFTADFDTNDFIAHSTPRDISNPVVNEAGLFFEGEIEAGYGRLCAVRTFRDIPFNVPDLTLSVEWAISIE
jgi:hypothetical protein